MEKHEVDDLYVNKYGYLHIKRLCESGYQTKDCPFTFTFIDGESSENSGFESKACGKWCPLFGEVEESTVCKPYQLQEPFFDGASKIYFPTSDPDGTAGIYQIKSISLCHKTIWCRVKQDEQKGS